MPFLMVSYMFIGYSMLYVFAELRKKLLKYHDMKNKLDIITSVVFCCMHYDPCIWCTK